MRVEGVRGMRVRDVVLMRVQGVILMRASNRRCAHASKRRCMRVKYGGIASNPGEVAGCYERRGAFSRQEFISDHPITPYSVTNAHPRELKSVKPHKPFNHSRKTRIISSTRGWVGTYLPGRYARHSRYTRGSSQHRLLLTF